MQMISEADAFRGRWSVHPAGWLRSFVPISLLVILQESETPYAAFGLVLLSALVQHVVAGGLIVAVGSLALRVRGAVPLGLVFVLWMLSGVLRGLIGGWFAEAFAGAAPDYGLRIAYWVVGTVVWMPLATYLLAQFDLHRRLIAEVETMTAQLAAQRAAATRSIEQRTTELVAAVRDAVAPLIAEVRATLRSAEASDSEISLGAITTRLEDIADEVRSVIVHAGGSGMQHSAPARGHWSPLVEALAFSRSRPVFLSLLTALAASALFVIDSLRVGGGLEFLEHLGSIAVGAVALSLGLLAARRARHFTPIRAVIVFLSAAVATQLTLLVVDVDMDSVRDRAMIAAVRLAFAGAATMIASAVGLGLGNLTLLTVLDECEADQKALAQSSRAKDAEIAGKVSLVLHGPLLGRLSACIMALNFYLAEPAQSRGLRRSATTDGVLAHLELVAADLEELTSPTQ